MIRHRTLKSMGEKWRNWKCSLKAKYYDETKTAAQIVATAPLTVNREHYADLVAYWFSKEGQVCIDVCFLSNNTMSLYHFFFLTYCYAFMSEGT